VEAQIREIQPVRRESGKEDEKSDDLKPRTFNHVQGSIAQNARAFRYAAISTRW